MYHATVFPIAASEDVAKVEQGPNKGENLLVPPKSLVHSLHRALLSAQEQIKRLTAENIALKEKNSRLKLMELRSSEALEKVTSLHNQAQKEKEEMEAMIKKLEGDLQKEKNDYQVLSKHQLGEISSLKAKLLIAQSQSNWMEEELKESKRELHQGRRQVEREITSLEQSLHIQQEETAARLSSMEHHWKEVIRVKEENAATKLRETDKKWQRRVCQLEEEMKNRRSLVSSLTDQMMSAIAEHKSTITLFRQNQSEFSLKEKTWENKCNALEESYRRELTEKEESWQRRLQDMERRNELEKMWLQKETEWRHKTSSLEEEVRYLTRENTELQVNSLYLESEANSLVYYKNWEGGKWLVWLFT